MWESELSLLAPTASLPFNAWHTRLIPTCQKWGGTSSRGGPPILSTMKEPLSRAASRHHQLLLSSCLALHRSQMPLPNANELASLSEW